MAAKIVARFAGMTVYEEAEALVYTVPEAEVCRLRKPGLPVEQPDPQRWPKGFITDLRAALNDPLAEQVLAAGEADFASVARLLPPLRDLAFLGDETTIERLEVTPEGAVVGREELACPVEGSLAGAGLLDDWLPVLVHRYDGASGPRELLQFATAGEGGGACLMLARSTVPLCFLLVALAGNLVAGPVRVCCLDFHQFAAASAPPAVAPGDGPQTSGGALEPALFEPDDWFQMMISGDAELAGKLRGGFAWRQPGIGAGFRLLRWKSFAGSFTLDPPDLALIAGVAIGTLPELADASVAASTSRISRPPSSGSSASLPQRCANRGS